MFHHFADSCGLIDTFRNTSDDDIVTYRHFSLNHKSCIDYVFVSQSLFANLLNVAVTDSGANLSDHVPVSVNFGGRVLSVNACKLSGMGKKCNYDDKCLRWDKADLRVYYDYTGMYLYPILMEAERYTLNSPCVNPQALINDLCRKLMGKRTYSLAL